MSLNNIKKMRSESGFTIVELLIVIVVIAILAAITIVAYTGINNRAKTSNAQTAANQVAKKAGAYNAVEGHYPADADAFSATGAPEESKLEGGVGIGTPQASTGEKTVGYEPCPADADEPTGAHVTYFDYNRNGVTNATSDPSWITVGNCS